MAVAWVEVAESLERGVFVVEDLDEDELELAGFGSGGEEGADPAVVGGEAAAGGFGGGVEHAHFAGGGHLLDDGLVLGDGELGIAAVGGIDHDFEEFGAEDGVGGLARFQALETSVNVWNSPPRRNSRCQCWIFEPAMPASL